MKSIGEPYEGEPHVRFDEGGAGEALWVSRVWLIEALARKRGVNELAAHLRMLGDHRTCSLLYPLSRLTYRNQKLPRSKRQIADLEPGPPADQVRPVSPRQHRGTFAWKHLCALYRA